MNRWVQVLGILGAISFACTGQGKEKSPFGAIQAYVGKDPFLQIGNCSGLPRGVGEEDFSNELRSKEEASLVRALGKKGIRWILVCPELDQNKNDGSLRERFLTLDAFGHFQGVWMAPEAALYMLRSDSALPPILAHALHHVARRILEGASPPRISSFPEPLRSIRPVEIMVLLSEGGRPRLWRSARSSSVARALVTAATVARERWRERESAMGGALNERLPYLDLQIFELAEDGTLADRSPAFLEKAFGPSHGVAFEYRGSWHYLLPEATREKGKGSALQAYRVLLEEQSLPPSALEWPELRLYRSVMRPIGAPLGSIASD
ncbi:MAG: hypothetical protein N2515_03545 [Deltaproteobacteria bacterium]|nr:hypothetical protein [Deltaproteobacteria bacterium]